MDKETVIKFLEEHGFYKSYEDDNLEWNDYYAEFKSICGITVDFWKRKIFQAERYMWSVQLSFKHNDFTVSTDKFDIVQNEVIQEDLFLQQEAKVRKMDERLKGIK